MNINSGNGAPFLAVDINSPASQMAVTDKNQ